MSKSWKRPLMMTLLMAIFTSGCAKSTLLPLHEIDSGAHPYSAVMVSVDAKVAEDVSKEVSDLQGEVISELRKQKRFQEVALLDSNNTGERLLVKASVIGIRKVGGGARLFLGAFAGEAYLATDVEFVDAATGKSLGAYSIKEQTGSSGYAGTTSESVKKTAKSIAKLAASHFATPLPPKK